MVSVRFGENIDDGVHHHSLDSLSLCILLVLVDPCARQDALDHCSQDRAKRRQPSYDKEESHENAYGHLVLDHRPDCFARLVARHNLEEGEAGRWHGAPVLILAPVGPTGLKIEARVGPLLPNEDRHGYREDPDDAAEEHHDAAHRFHGFLHIFEDQPQFPEGHDRFYPLGAAGGVQDPYGREVLDTYWFQADDGHDPNFEDPHRHQHEIQATEPIHSPFRNISADAVPQDVRELDVQRVRAERRLLGSLIHLIHSYGEEVRRPQEEDAEDKFDDTEHREKVVNELPNREVRVLAVVVAHKIHLKP
mmetsp:Transcript_67247/g.193361  ORF Transcript_67247/g.193361 Transcript_67247/m.193361 type:complete len:306 (+) Transcript_67247:935-1852(+)